MPKKTEERGMQFIAHFIYSSNTDFKHSACNKKNRQFYGKLIIPMLKKSAMQLDDMT